jgi:hypothetical protein
MVGEHIEQRGAGARTFCERCNNNTVSVLGHGAGQESDLELAAPETR